MTADAVEDVPGSLNKDLRVEFYGATEQGFQIQDVQEPSQTSAFQDIVTTSHEFPTGLQDIPKNTITNMVSAATNIERWLQGSRHGDSRGIRTIPPVQLDSYLGEFFTTVKRPDGGDYRPQTFQSLRSHLEHYLRQCNYPESITSSQVFVQSRQAFAARKQELIKQAALVDSQLLSTNKVNKICSN